MRTLWTLAGLACLIACSGAPAGSDAGLDAGLDAGSDAGCVGTPSPPGTCLPAPCSLGNSLNVGAYCTRGGGQCTGYPNGQNLACAIDLDPNRGADFCILLGCLSNADCKEDACCTQGACVPLDCLATDAGVCPAFPATDGGTDGG
ncbi:MAG: hypothetical protein ACYCWW_08865 [Deltaproteobacteria bacterium]